MQTNLECFETWSLTDAEMNYVKSPAFNQTTAPRHIRVEIKA